MQETTLSDRHHYFARAACQHICCSVKLWNINHTSGSLHDLTNSMQKSLSWEASNHSTSQEIPHLLRNLKVYYCVHNSLSVVTVFSQMNPVHTFPPYFPKISILILEITVQKIDVQYYYIYFSSRVKEQ